ncbi:MAG: ABC transporter permease [Spirochaetes bacterium]|nr:ABC transporter permease [Spirochaetota bacterium]
MRSLLTALNLILSGDRELFTTVGTSLSFSFFSTLFAGILGIAISTILILTRLPVRRFLISVFNSFMAVPTVVVGLLVYSLLSRSGPLGSLGWLFSPYAVILGQSIFALPIVISYLWTGYSRLDIRFFETMQTLGCSFPSKCLLVWKEAEAAIVSAILSSFGRVLSEVGISMMLGGNIRWYTRTMTTAIALEITRGEYEYALALGILLLLLAIGINTLTLRLVGPQKEMA